MAEIIRSPELMKRNCEELNKEFDLNPVKDANVMKLPYLQACIKEGYKLQPPTPLLLPRRAPETCKLMDYTIPKNTRILVNVWAIGRDPLIWNEPSQFRPKRFLDSAALDFKGNDFEFLPFGAGRRICPMAGVLVPLVLASLLHSFDWSIPHGKEPQQLVQGIRQPVIKLWSNRRCNRCILQKTAAEIEASAKRNEHQCTHAEFVTQGFNSSLSRPYLPTIPEDKGGTFTALHNLNHLLILLVLHSQFFLSFETRCSYGKYHHI